MENLTPRAEEIYAYLQKNESGVPPTIREIQAALGIGSTSTVFRYLTELSEKGYIAPFAGKKRGIILTGEQTTKVPLLGKVAAGTPIMAIENIDGYISFNGKGEDLFALRVQGDSMIDIGIFEDDIVIVKSTPVAENGEIVVAMVDDSATVKRFFKENGHFRLQAENMDYDPIIAEEVTILGRVVGLIRNYE